MSKHWYNKLFIPLLLTAILFRFWGFWKPSFSSDEATYVIRAFSVASKLSGFLAGRLSDSDREIFLLQFLQHSHGPMEFIFMIPAIILRPRYSTAEFLVRLTWVLFSSATLIWSSIWLRRIRNQTLSILFLIFYGLSVYAIWWSQTAMYQSISMAASIFFSLALIRFTSNPSNRSLFWMFASLAFGLLVFPDLILFLPAAVWAIYDQRHSITAKGVAAGVVFLIITAGIFYIPWIWYSTLPGTEKVGFRFLLQRKLLATVNPISNLTGFWQNFFSFPGVLVVWPISFFSVFLIRRVRYLKYLILSVILFSTVYITRAYIAYFYFVSIFPVLCLMAAEVTIAVKKRTFLFIGGTALAVQLWGVMPLIRGIYNPLIFSAEQQDRIRDIGKLARLCIPGDDETYISTEDTRTNYYFGKLSKVYQDGADRRIARMRQFLEGDMDQVKLIHFRAGLLPMDLEQALRTRATWVITYRNDTALFFKDCSWLKTTNLN